MAEADAQLEQRAIDVVRGLAMDAPQRASSGHPGTAMALAPLAHVLWTRVMSYDAEALDWPDRDRFVLSAGHASILLYSMLHLTGSGLTMDDLKAFRQFGSRTPGHPEARHTDGVEVTTGPLGQGLGNSVGMALAERWSRARFGTERCDHRTWAICSDGDLMEGLSHEAASLAGHLGLGRLTWIYDDNHITIDGATELAFTDDTVRRFGAYGWHVLELGEVANDTAAIEAGLREAMAVEDRPSLVVLRTQIGWPSPKLTGTAKAHGSPFGPDEVRATKEVLGLPPDEEFWVPDDVLAHWRAAGRRGGERRRAWEERLAAWTGPEREAWDAALAGRGLDGWAEKLPRWQPGESLATRQAVQACVDASVDVVPGLVTGSADLTENTGMAVPGQRLTAESPAGRQVSYGVREHAMGAALVGMAMHGGVVPVGATFFVFSDYMKPAIRTAAISQARAIFVFTHDSVGLGEDGPTHQPVEHLAALRAVPGLTVIRPADANETAAAWRLAVEAGGPVALVLSRQKLPVLEGTDAEGVARGAYAVLDEGDGEPDLVLVGTGGEVSLCVGVAERLRSQGLAVRVVSMPSWELFARQPYEVRQAVLPAGVPKMAVEAGSTLGWAAWVDAVVGLNRFGESAPGTQALEKLGFNVDDVTQGALRLLGRA